VIDTNRKDWSTQDWVSKDWSKFYPDINAEIIPPDAPEGLDEPVQVNLFCDASNATNLIMRCSTTGIIFFLNGTPINWYSRRQNTIESSTFGSIFVALKIATEMNDALCYKLRMFGIRTKISTNAFCDNKSVVINVAHPESTLTKKHNAIAYHKVRECVAMKALRVCHEAGEMNCSDILTKFLGYDAHYKCCGYILFC
jgi:hypothetical protein